MKNLIFVALLTVLIPLTGFSEGPVYTETVSYQITVAENGDMNVRKTTRVFKDGVEIAKTYHRHVLNPGDNVDNEPDKVKDHAGIAWTPAVIADYEARKLAKENALPK